MSLFHPAPPPNTLHLAHLKAAVRRHFAPNDVVAQHACLEPGCPPIETTIGILGAESRLLKIHKPIADITDADVASLGAPR